MPRLAAIPEFYVFLLHDSIPVFTALVLIAAVMGRRVPSIAVQKGLLRHETVAAAAFVLLPACAVVMAKAGKLGYGGRYVLAASIGFSVLAARAMQSQFRGPAVIAFAVVLLGWCTASIASTSKKRWQRPVARSTVTSPLGHARPSPGFWTLIVSPNPSPFRVLTFFWNRSTIRQIRRPHESFLSARRPIPRRWGSGHSPA